ncbi:MAG: glycoside hydrolase family 95 protein [Opitutus sp.]
MTSSRAGDADTLTTDKPLVRGLNFKVLRWTLVSLVCAHAGRLAGDVKPQLLWYDRPASRWVEALPLGNGRIGAMVFGGIGVERIQLNEDTLWGGGPYSSVDPRAREALPEIRRLLSDGHAREAQDLANSRFLAKPIRQMPYQTLGDIILTLPEPDAAVDYRRELDLDTGVATTSFRIGAVEHRRETFISAVDQVLVIRITARDRRSAYRGSLDLLIGMQSPQRASTSTADNHTIVLAGRNGDAQGIEGALRFEARLAVSNEGGSVTSEGGTLRVAGADRVTVVMSAATSFRNYRDVSGDPAVRNAETLAHVAGKTFDELLAAHRIEHQRLFRRVQLDLGASKDAQSVPTDERLRRAQSTPDPELAALYFQFGRYLLISSSRPGTQPANLQGIWTDSMNPPWESKYTININTEMNYWPAEVANLSECVEPLFSMVRDLSETGAIVAREQYGARGWVVHHNTDLWRAAAPVDGAFSGVWPMGGAWLTVQLWEHYRFSGDPKFLRELFPILRGAAEFFLDTLVPDPSGRWLVTSPSSSPENAHHPGVSIAAGPTMDLAILRDLFGACLEATRVLSEDAAFSERVAAALGRLPPLQIGAQGQLQEWLEDWDAGAPEQQHRHVSHLYALHPSNQITPRGTPELAAAAKRTLETRGDFSTGWAIAWRLNPWARLHDGERAHRILSALLSPKRTYPNLFDTHPPFQIDGNFGGTAGIAEMLLQSQAGELEFLPALPSAWPDGSISGLRARGGFVVDLQWSHGRLDVATVHASQSVRTTLRYGEVTSAREFKSGETVRWTP